jgi:hypothetical protein
MMSYPRKGIGSTRVECARRSGAAKSTELVLGGTVVEAEDVVKPPKWRSTWFVVANYYAPKMFLRQIAVLVVLAIVAMFVTSRTISIITKGAAHQLSSSRTTGVENNPSNDDLSKGKSCQYKRQRWHCQTCNGLECKRLRPKGQCRAFPRIDWDSPPRVQSEYNPETSANAALLQTRTLSFLGKLYYHHQPLCTISLCFDLSRCSAHNLTVYANETGTGEHHELLDFAFQHASTPIKRVDRHEEACIVLVTPHTYSSAQALLGAAHWNDGKNHLLWKIGSFPYVTTPKSSGDVPFTMYHVGQAMVASVSLTLAQTRPGYDFVLPLPRLWGRVGSTSPPEIHRPRKWLLTFRGSIQNSKHPYYQHRWLAAEYWDEADDVIADVQCKYRKLMSGEKVTYKPYDLPSSVFDDLLWNSTFGFAPGGSGVSSFRFGEILSTGGIPVVVAGDFVPPLAPEMDWSGCIVFVSEARIVDLPNILRRYSQGEIRARQTSCWRLLQTVIGDRQRGSSWYHDERVTFTKAMEILALRVSNAIHMSEQLGILNQ